MPHLLISVQSSEEMETALAAGADVIDIKDPARGSLGRADDARIHAMATQIAGRAGLSVALGELSDEPAVPALPPGTFIKVGLAGLVAEPRWPTKLAAFWDACRHADSGRLRPVAVAYADASRVAAPAWSAVLPLARSFGVDALLLDTAVKDGTTLLDHCRLSELAAVAERCHRADMRLALAGSLTAPHIEILLPIQPDLIAVRGAATVDGGRASRLCDSAIRRLVRLVHGSDRKSTTRTTGIWAASRGNRPSTNPA